MKKIASSLVLTLFACFALQAQAQDNVSKELLLTTLNSVAHLKFENEQVSQLMEYNTGFVDQVHEILNSDKEDKHKKELLDALSNTREVELHGFLSKHETKKYLKYMEDEMKPLVRKNKLLKHISKY
jgi:ubiquitin C-terminal hydrolase